MSISIEKAKEKLKDNKYCLEAWNVLLKDAQDKSIEETRSFYEELVQLFPTSGRFWKTYIEKEIKSNNFSNAQFLFESCLNNVLNIDLWKLYLQYLKQTKSNEPNFLSLMIDSYDSALNKCGLDVLSYTIWNDYINFLKSSLNDLNLISNIYRRALKNPMINIEQMYFDYCNFKQENNLEIDLEENEYEFIRKISKEYENITRPLQRHLPAIPLEYIRQENKEHEKQIVYWKRYIKWEKQNPLQLTDSNELMKRVLFAYEQSFLCLAYHCDIWHDAACYLYKECNQMIPVDDINTKQMNDEAASCLYERACNTFMKNSVLINLAYADFEESRKNYQKCYEIYEKCLKNNQIEPSLIWINYIKFVKRTEDLQTARKLFKRAREDPRAKFHLFIANANLEYFCTKDKTIGFKIFHLGAKKYSNEEDYNLSYLKYMSHLNEDNNTRVLFERILSSDDAPIQKSQKIWSEFLKFECSVGDLASILKVDKKRQKVFETEQQEQTCLMVDRYKYLDLMPCNYNELKSLGFKDTDLEQLNIKHVEANNNADTIDADKNDEEIVQTELDERKRKLPKPDVTQMMPFKPIRNVLSNTITGGIFSLPQVVSDLVKRLPPPHAFEGPFVKIDEFIRLFQEIDDMNIEFGNFQPNYVYINGEPIKEFEHLANSHRDGQHHKRHHGSLQSNQQQSQQQSSNGNNSDDEDNKKTKLMDIYKERQYKKLLLKK